MQEIKQEMSEQNLNNTFKPYHIGFGNKHHGKPYDTVYNEDKQYIDFLRNMKEPTKGISHFIEFCNKKDQEPQQQFKRPAFQQNNKQRRLINADDLKAGNIGALGQLG